MTTPKKQQDKTAQTAAETTPAPAETTRTTPAPAEADKTTDTTADTVVLRTPPFLDAYTVADTTITRQGTRVPANKAAEILAAAKRARIKLEQPR